MSKIKKMISKLRDIWFLLGIISDSIIITILSAFAMQCVSSSGFTMAGGFVFFIIVMFLIGSIYFLNDAHDDLKKQKLSKPNIPFSKEYEFPKEYDPREQFYTELSSISKSYSTRLINRSETETCFEVNLGNQDCNIIGEDYKADVRIVCNLMHAHPLFYNNYTRSNYLQLNRARALENENYILIDIKLDRTIKDAIFATGSDGFLKHGNSGDILINKNHILYINRFYDLSIEEKIKNIQETISSIIDEINNYAEDLENYSKTIEEIDNEFDLVKSSLIELEDISSNFTYSNYKEYFKFIFEFDDIIKNNAIDMGDKSLELFKSLSNFNSSLHLLGKDYKNYFKLIENDIEITLYHGIELDVKFRNNENVLQYLNYIKDRFGVNII